MSIDLHGYCPMGCGRTLFAAERGYIMCRDAECPHPLAASQLLADSETEHVVQFEAHTFTVRHPLRERLGDELMTCELHGYIASLPGPLDQLGTYRAIRDGDGWSFTRQAEP